MLDTGSLGSGCPHRDQQWALTFQCGFVVLYFGLKDICISICIYCFSCGILSYRGLLACRNPGSLRTHSQLIPKGRWVSFSACHGSSFISLTFTADLHWLAFVWFLTQFLLGQTVNVSSHAFAPWIGILVSLSFRMY